MTKAMHTRRLVQLNRQEAPRAPGTKEAMHVSPDLLARTHLSAPDTSATLATCRKPTRAETPTYRC
jgi:hypothetical protein